MKKSFLFIGLLGFVVPSISYCASNYLSFSVQDLLDNGLKDRFVREGDGIKPDQLALSPLLDSKGNYISTKHIYIDAFTQPMEWCYLGHWPRCSSLRGIQNIPQSDKDAVVNFVVIGCKKLQSLEAGLLSGFKNLQAMSIKCCESLSGVARGAFKGLSKLDRLELRSNPMMQKLWKDYFKGLSNLSFLDLTSNEIRTIEDNAFAGLNNLWTLWLKWNKIEHLTSKTFAGLKNVRSIDLEYNPIISVDRDTFKHLSTLECIYVDAKVEMDHVILPKGCTVIYRH